MNLTSKLPDAGTTIFTVMSALAREHGAINLSQGFPDFGCEPELQELASKYIRDGYNQYAPMAGTVQLRERISAIIKSCYEVKFDPESEITVTAGATQGIYTCIAALINPGDEVIVFEPAYDCYIPAIRVHGGIPVICSLKAPDFTIAWEDVRRKITDRTKAIIINSPHNPTGSVISQQDLLQLAGLVRDTGIVIISDEVYEHMVFDGQRHHTVCSVPELRERSVVVSSFGKTVHTTGWKIGYVAAPAALMAEFRKVHQFLVFVVNHPLQLALADFLGDASRYRGLADFYEQKRNLFLEQMKGSRFKPLPCKGTYFQLMSYERISDENDAELAIRLTKEKKVATIPLSAFYSTKKNAGLLRFCFAKKNETIESAAEILRSL